MVNEIEQHLSEQKAVLSAAVKKDHTLAASVLVSSIILAGAWIYTSESTGGFAPGRGETDLSKLEEEVLPSKGVLLPVTWDDLGVKLVNEGVIDAEKFRTIYAERDSFTDEYSDLLLENNNGKMTITADNSGYLLNLFWALGLANKNRILDEGEMTNPAYGGAENFASTAGWTIARGDAMEHYSRHAFIALTAEQQVLVEKVAKGIYRPCCGNSTIFPDCNHGMAMLGLLELMASQGVSEKDMWETALAVNAYWFPDNYLTIATYMKGRGVEWSKVDPQEILGADYSSSRGYANIAAETAASSRKQNGSGCSLEDQPGERGRQQVGCGI